MFYLVLALLFSLLIAVVAMGNGEIVTVHYLFGQARLSLIVLILGSACAGALTMGFFSLFRSIRTHLKFRDEHRNQEELQRRLELMEDEKNKLEAELGRRQLEREAAVAKEYSGKEASQAGDEPELS
jgi:lipopolysaccharide assembly protein A